MMANQQTSSVSIVDVLIRKWSRWIKSRCMILFSSRESIIGRYWIVDNLVFGNIAFLMFQVFKTVERLVVVIENLSFLLCLAHSLCSTELKLICWICCRNENTRVGISILNSVVLLNVQKQRREKNVCGNLFTFFPWNSMRFIEILFKLFSIIHVEKTLFLTVHSTVVLFSCAYLPSNWHHGGCACILVWFVAHILQESYRKIEEKKKTNYRLRITKRKSAFLQGS